jgi:hypothetical protein
MGHPMQGTNYQLGSILYSTKWNIEATTVAVNHALAYGSLVINQARVLASFLVKDEAVRSYRTDPVQVRSCWASGGIRY